MFDLCDAQALSHSGEVWAEAENATVEKLIKDTYHPDSSYKAYMIESGFSNHQTACDGKCPEVTNTELAFVDSPLGKTCPEDLKPKQK